MLGTIPHSKTLVRGGIYFLQGLKVSTVASQIRFRPDRNRGAIMTVYKRDLKQAAVLIHKTPHPYREYLVLTTNVSKYGMAGWALGKT
jgi:hypothetical protein